MPSAYKTRMQLALQLALADACHTQYRYLGLQGLADKMAFRFGCSGFV